MFRFTGSEINTDAMACVQRVIEACGLAPDEEPVYDIRTKFAGEDHPHGRAASRSTCAIVRQDFPGQPKHRTERDYCSRKCAAQARRGQPQECRDR